MSIVPRRTIGTSALLVLVTRVLLLLAAAALAAAGFALAFRDESEAAAATAHYACPMHPEVSAAAPGQCPICKMALERDEASKPRQAVAAEPRRSEAAEERPAPEIASAEAPKTNTMLPPRSSFAAGATWLPEMFPPAQQGQPGDRPALGTPKRRVFVEAIRAAAWLETPDRLVAVLYQDELSGLSSGELGTFYRAAAPRVPIDVRLDDEPPLVWDTSTSQVRFVIQPRSADGADEHGARIDAAATARPGDVGWLELPARPRELLVFPESALLRSSDRPYVLVPGADQQSFVRRAVHIGRILKGNVVVLSGLRAGEPIVIGNAFFLDAEQRAEAGAEPVAKVEP